jgi:hypothetical protein
MFLTVSRLDPVVTVQERLSSMAHGAGLSPLRDALELLME